MRLEGLGLGARELRPTSERNTRSILVDLSEVRVQEATNSSYSNSSLFLSSPS